MLADELRAPGRGGRGTGPRRRSFRRRSRPVVPGQSLAAHRHPRAAARSSKRPSTSPDELYEAVRTIDWSQYLTPEHTLAVDCNVRDSHITHSKYAALRVKDAICDQFIDAAAGGRASMSRSRWSG